MANAQIRERERARPEIKPFFRPQKARKPKHSSSPASSPSSSSSSFDTPLPPPLITEEEALEYVSNLTPANLRKLNCMIGGELARMVMPWGVSGPLWAYVRRKVITELIAKEVVLEEQFFKESG